MQAPRTNPHAACPPRQWRRGGHVAFSPRGKDCRAAAPAEYSVVCRRARPMTRGRLRRGVPVLTIPRASPPPMCATTGHAGAVCSASPACPPAACPRRRVSRLMRGRASRIQGGDAARRPALDSAGRSWYTRGSGCASRSDRSACLPALPRAPPSSLPSSALPCAQHRSSHPPPPTTGTSAARHHTTHIHRAIPPRLLSAAHSPSRKEHGRRPPRVRPSCHAGRGPLSSGVREPL